jgi:hypothetical protein
MAKVLKSNKSLFWIVPMLITMSAFAAACASLPLAISVTDLSQIAGKWQGAGYGPAGAASVTQTINADGTYSAELPSGTFTGKIAISDGKLRGRSDQSGSTGTYSLHEGNGKRVLTYKSDDGRISSELTPAK